MNVTVEKFANENGYDLKTLLTFILDSNVTLMVFDKIRDWDVFLSKSVPKDELAFCINNGLRDYSYTESLEEPIDSGVIHSFHFNHKLKDLVITPTQYSLLTQIFIHSPDYSYVKFKDEEYFLTNNQAKIIKALHTKWKEGIKSLSHSELEDIVQIPQFKFKDQFQKKAKKISEDLISRDSNNHYSLKI